MSLIYSGYFKGKPSTKERRTSKSSGVIISPLWEKRKLCIEEINALIKQRDELLPLLMNGQASVNSDLSDD